MTVETWVCCNINSLSKVKYSFCSLEVFFLHGRILLLLSYQNKIFFDIIDLLMNFNSNQRSKVIQGLRSFKDTLPTKVKKLLKQKGEVYSELIENWRMFVGDELFSLSYPKKYLSSNKFRKSVLEVMVKRGHEVELEYSKKNIVDKINSYFGYDLISTLKVYTFDRKDEKLKSIKKSNSKINLGEIKNKKIENSLKEFAKVYKEKND